MKSEFMLHIITKKLLQQETVPGNMLQQESYHNSLNLDNDATNQSYNQDKAMLKIKG
jgi:hypothetical protein